MDKNLQQRLAKVLDGNNKEAAWTMGRRYLTEETLYWAMGANYPSANLPDREYDVERFIEAWESNTDYEIVMAGDFEGKADIAVGRDYSNDCVKVTLYGASTEDGDPGLYAALLSHVADWIGKNGDAVQDRKGVKLELGYFDGMEGILPELMSQPSVPSPAAYEVTLSSHVATPVVTLKPGPTGNTLSAMPGADLTPEAKVLFDEIVSNFEDWLHDNDLEPWEVVMAAAAAQSYIAGRMMDVIAVE